MQWTQTYGGSDWDEARSVIQTADGGFVLAGCSRSFGAGRGNFWLVKTNTHGVVEWNRTFGGPLRDTVNAVIQTADSGFALAGWANVSMGVKGKAWLIKTNHEEYKQWQLSFGGVQDVGASSVIETSDGGFVLVGWTESSGAGLSDFLLVKIGLTPETPPEFIPAFEDCSVLFAIPFLLWLQKKPRRG